MGPADDTFDVAFVLLEEAVLPDADRLTRIAAGLDLDLHQGERTQAEGEVALYDDAAGQRALMIALVPAAHPDAAELCSSVTSPEAELATRAPAHLIVTIFRGDGVDEVRARDARAMKMLAAVLRSTPSVAAMFGHGTAFHRAEFFDGIGADCAADALPYELCIDLTAGHDDGGRLSFLTRGMDRYGSENILVHADPENPDESIDFLLSIAAWCISDPDVELPTGETLGRGEDEQVFIERGPSPIDETETVMILRLDEAADAVDS